MKRHARPAGPNRVRTLAIFAALVAAMAGALRAGPPSPSGSRGEAIVAGATGLQLQWIPPGDFFLGDVHQAPITTVRITRGFWMGRFDVTQRQWQALMGSNPSHFKDQGGDAPVENVSWDDAAAFCRAVNLREKAEGRLPEGYEYRLPTEAEWEYACRAGTTGAYAGDGVMDDMGWYARNSGMHTHPVGQKLPNAWGLFDMEGNVWQWCLDWFGPYPGGVETDPAGPTSGSSRVYRGGCWFVVAEHCRSAFRFASLPVLRDYYLGFRIALAPEIKRNPEPGP